MKPPVSTFAKILLPATPCHEPNLIKDKGKAVPLQGWMWPRGLQEVKVPRLHDNGTGWW
jgi:hypothetical protein